MVFLFFVCWALDSLSFFMFGYSTVVSGVVSLPVLFVGMIVSLCLGLHLISKSHIVFDEGHSQPKLVDSGVYALVRHPMYLGTLLFCLSFLFISFSLVSFGVWIAFFIFYDRMAAYEEESLTKILGEGYVAYEKRVPKWFPKLTSRKSKRTH
jgi:protein-S-isoprenylcysteine O-methyltransferase Ste14